MIDFSQNYIRPYICIITKEICNILNDDGGVIHSLERDGLEFKVNGFLFYIRGWGQLTGIGGLYLSVTKAKEIQDEFADCVYNKLKYHLK